MGDEGEVPHLLDVLVLLDDVDRVPPAEGLHVGKLARGVVEDVGEDRDLARGGRGDELVRADERAASAALAWLGGRTDLCGAKCGSVRARPWCVRRAREDVGWGAVIERERTSTEPILGAMSAVEVGREQ